MSVLAIAIVSPSKSEMEALTAMLPRIHLVVNGSDRPIYHANIKVTIKEEKPKPAIWNEVLQLDAYKDLDWIWMVNPLFEGYSPTLLKTLTEAAKALPRLGGLTPLLPTFKDELFHKQGGFILRSVPYVLPIATLLSVRCYRAIGPFDPSIGADVYKEWCARATQIGWRFMVHEGLEINEVITEQA